MDHLMESKEDERTVCGRVRSGKQSDDNLKKNSDRLARPRAREPQESQFSPEICRPHVCERYRTVNGGPSCLECIMREFIS